MKSPIKENINNFKCLSVLKELIPKGSVVNSFLFFSGNLELNLAESERFVIAHTNKYVIYEFWKCALEDPCRIADLSETLFPVGDEKMFHILQERWPEYKDHFTRSALFFLLNRCSDSGWISAGHLEDKNFNPLAFSYLKKFSPKNFFLVLDDAKDLNETIEKNNQEGDFLFFPIGKFNYNFFEHGKSKGYEMTTIYHKRLYEALQNIEDKWIVLYKNHPGVHKLYQDYNIIMLNKYGRTTKEKDSCEEVVIANF